VCYTVHTHGNLTGHVPKDSLSPLTQISKQNCKELGRMLNTRASTVEKIYLTSLVRIPHSKFGRPPTSGNLSRTAVIVVDYAGLKIYLEYQLDTWRETLIPAIKTHRD